MLKIGVIRWRGKCSRHPMFDPLTDGPGAVRGGCEKCTTLVEIFNCHQKMLALMRGFTPPQKKSPVARGIHDAQESLF